jgi:hypothetical protein
MVRGSDHGAGEIFRTRSGWQWGPPRLIHNGYRVSFPWATWAAPGVDHSLQSCAKVTKRVQLYLYSPLGPSRPVPRQTLLSAYIKWHKHVVHSLKSRDTQNIWKNVPNSLVEYKICRAIRYKKKIIIVHPNFLASKLSNISINLICYFLQ